MRKSTLAALAAASEIMVAAGAPLIGAIVSFDISSSSVERTVMRKAISDAGYPAIARAHVPDVTVAQGLKAAPAQLKPPKGLAVLPVPDHGEDSSLEFAIWKGDPKATSRGAEKPVMGARVRVNQAGVAEALPPKGVEYPLRDVGEGDEEWSAEEQACSECMSYAYSLANRANRLARFVETNDVTGALSAVLTSMHGAKQASHTRGGFILARYVPTWVALTDALAPFGVKGKLADLYGLPTHIAEARETAEASFGEKIRDLRERLAKAVKGTGVRSDSIQRSLDECLSLVNEAKMFEDILGDTVKAIAQEANAVRALFVKIQGGDTRVVYGAADVDKPLSFGEQPAPSEPEAPAVQHLTDGTTVIPSGDGASA